MHHATIVVVAIKGFKHDGLKRFFDGNDGRRLPQDRLNRINDILDGLHQAAVAADMNQPGYRLHPLKGDRKGYWSVRVFRELANCVSVRGWQRPRRRPDRLPLKKGREEDGRRNHD